MTGSSSSPQVFKRHPAEAPPRHTREDVEAEDNGKLSKGSRSLLWCQQVGKRPSKCPCPIG